MQRGQRHLGGAGQEQLVLGHAVDLLLGVGQHARAEQGLLAHQHRRHHRREPLLLEQLEHPLDERELEPHERPLQVDEARARHARALLEAEVLARAAPRGCARSARLALLAQHLVLGRRGRVGRVRQRRQQRRRAAPRPRAAPPRAASRAPRRSFTSAIASDASAPVRCSSPICFEASFFSRLSSSSSRQQRAPRARPARAPRRAARRRTRAGAGPRARAPGPRGSP